jgi:hypothetical protein
MEDKDVATYGYWLAMFTTAFISICEEDKEKLYSEKPNLVDLERIKTRIKNIILASQGTFYGQGRADLISARYFWKHQQKGYKKIWELQKTYYKTPTD